MKKQFVFRRWRKGFARPAALSLVLSVVFRAGNCPANPQGLTVVSGSAHPSQQGSTLEITTSRTALLNWNSFNIAAGETTIFNQPSATSVVVNNINNASPSAIYGSLRANGIVVLQNSAGFYFGPNAFVSAGGLVVTTYAMNPWSFGGGAAWSFSGPPVQMPIVNYGHLQTAAGGSLFVIANQIDNHGTISTPGGTAALVAGQEVLLCQRSDGLGLSAPVKLPAGSVNNQGQITADAGQILLQAQTVNNSGELQANSVRQENGVIELYASQDVQLAASSVLQANGSASGSSPGGNITIKSGDTFSDSPGSQITTTGGANGGNGGNVTLCAPNMLSLNSSMNAEAQSGYTAGTLFLDPTTIDINSAGTGTIPSSGTESRTATPTTLTLSPTYLNGFSSLDLQATSSIALQSSWVVPANSGLTSITLQAGTGGITVSDGAGLTVQNGASVNLIAGASFNTLTSVTKAASGSGITLSGSGSVSTTTGGLALIAGGGITTGTGTIGSTGGNILLQAQDQGISLGTGQWVLPDVTTPATVDLEAAGNLTLASGGRITAGNDWSLNLGAGVNNFNTTASIGGASVPFSVAKAASSSAAGTITLSGTAKIQTANGAINALAGNALAIGSGGIVSGIDNGAVMAGGGGNVSVQALFGTVNCGTASGGYTFGPNGAAVSPSVGDISTAAGGNVYIQAGGNITCLLPTGTGASETDSGSGAFGSAPGNVTLIAGGNVTGHYVVADGVGSIAAVNGGTSGANLGLSLVKGGWTVNASQNIYLSEVRNPNGMLNTTSGSENFLFNYDPLSSVLLNAGIGVNITGSSLLRGSGFATSATSTELVFPPSLTIDGGAGGITLPSALVLFPSPEGTLNLTTTGGGNLAPKAGSSGSSLTLSDSSYQQYTRTLNFTPSAGGSDPLLHLNDPNPATINISGSISDFSLFCSKPVEMHAGGDIDNSSATAVNLHPSDTTAISAGGEIFDQSGAVILTLPPGEKPDFAALAPFEDQYLNPLTGLPVASSYGLSVVVHNPNYNGNFTVNNTPIGELFTYDAATGQMIYTGGVLPQATEAALLSMNTPFLDPATIMQFYQQSQSVVQGPLTPYQVAGPGTFKISANSIDLGTSDGLISLGIAPATGSGSKANEFAALAPYTTRGADLDISTVGNLSMVSSAIVSEYGGAINITAGGSIDVGSPVLGLLPPPNGDPIRGIVSLWQGDISIVADENINVDGSRIAAYDGGNIYIDSLQGNVDAGSGGSGEVEVLKPYINKEGQVTTLPEIIPGSGILASSFPQAVYGDPSGSIGNITVETPEGNIVAGKGGIQQLALAAGTVNDSSVTLTAGSKNSDGSVAYLGSIDASGSGIVGGNVNLSATGNINGLVIASVSANVTAIQNVSATILSSGAATVSAGGTVSGSVVGLGTVSVSGASDVAAAFSATSVSASGSVSGAAATAAPTGSSSAAAAATTQQVNNQTQAGTEMASNSDDEELRKKKAHNTLMEYVGRVRVLLPQ